MCQEIPASPSMGHLRCCVFYIQLLHRQLHALTSVHPVHELFQNLKQLGHFKKRFIFISIYVLCVFVCVNVYHVCE